MRGKVQYGRTARRPVRITPAYAGKRKILGGENGGNQDHPRLCGEKEFPRNFNNCITGSPPPMRGKDCRSADNVQRIRITPAYAGKRQVRCRCPPERQDHPRLCGEKFTCFTIVFPPDGSPPPMRGKVPEQGLIRLRDGITPAYAGKSADSMPCTILLQDHPRLCGEKVQGVWQCLSIKGSPPPMRGKG